MSQSNVTQMREHDWKKGLVYKLTKDGSKLTTETGNAFLMLSNGEWKGRLAYDSFTDRHFWAKPGIPVENFDVPKSGELLSDYNLVYLQHYLSRQGNPDKCAFGRETISDAAHAACKRNAKNSLVDWLNSLQWDGVQRLPVWCAKTIGCHDSPYAAAVGTWWMISAVARAMRPGCKADHMLYLEGKQGAAKSSVFAVLGGEWYLPQLPDLRNPVNAYQVMRGKWIGEVPELDALKRAELSAVKAFMTVSVDVYRKAYGRTVEHVPRTIVFGGTTNDDNSLNDPTGARRFWPMTCKKIDLGWLREHREQLFAEAVARFETGEQWWPTDSLASVIEQEQEARYAGDSWEAAIVSWADKQTKGFGVPEILGGCLSIERKDWNRSHETRVGAIMQRAGYESERVRDGDRRVRVYKPKAVHTVPPSEDDD